MVAWVPFGECSWELTTPFLAFRLLVSDLASFPGSPLLPANIYCAFTMCVATRHTKHILCKWLSLILCTTKVYSRNQFLLRTVPQGTKIFLQTQQVWLGLEQDRFQWQRSNISWYWDHDILFIYLFWDRVSYVALVGLEPPRSVCAWVGGTSMPQ